MGSLRRRDFLRSSLTLSGAAALAPWLAACGSDDGALGAGAATGEVSHLLPTVSSDRILLKASFVAPQAEAPHLRLGRRRVRGVQTDSRGLFWAFDIGGLEAGRRYALELRRGPALLMEPWELSTFPDPQSRPQRFRLLVYGCAGGHDAFNFYVPVATRRRLLRRALDFSPNAVVVSGDHVYWDLSGFAGRVFGNSPTGVALAGVFDRALPVLGTANEAVLLRAVGAQIAGLYGTLFRSLPVFFQRDDHDYFEDDRVEEDLVTLPPDAFARALARATQWLYYPELLPDMNRPLDLPGANAGDRPPGVGESFGTLRYGRTFEGLLYDCKGYLELSGAAANVVPAAVEAWLHARLADRDIAHVVNFPSNPPGWSAGKYAEWYPDVVAEGALTTAIAKPGWQAGWFAQHNRLLESAATQRALPLFVASDIHSIGEERIVRSGGLDLRANPIVAVIAGTPGTAVGWPSRARGTVALPPTGLQVEEVVPVQEVNGFHLLDCEPDRITIRHFRWDRLTQSEDEIDSLEPFHVSEYRV